MLGPPRAFLAALRSEDGSLICPLLTDETRRAMMGEAQQQGPDVSTCEAAADRLFHGVGRILGNPQSVSVVARGDVAEATAVFDNGTETFHLRRAAGGQWLAELPRA